MDGLASAVTICVLEPQPVVGADAALGRAFFVVLGVAALSLGAGGGGAAAEEPVSEPNQRLTRLLPPEGASAADGASASLVETTHDPGAGVGAVAGLGAGAEDFGL